jgi:glycosyltransferase involved in cell wall biosynthesis
LRKNNNLVLIPVHNEEKTILSVLKKVKKYSYVLVVDDFSNDKTRVIAKKYSDFYIRTKKNIGYDKAIFTGLKFAIKKKFLKVVLIDGDNQHPSSKISLFFKKLDNYEYVIGIRNKKNRFLETLISFFFNLFFKIQDPLCGMKGLSLKNSKIILKYAKLNLAGMQLNYLFTKNNYKIYQFTNYILRKENLIPSYWQLTFSSNVKLFY